MPARRRGSIRLWQTELFVIVIMVAILILSGSLSAGLKSTLTRMTETSELRNASAFAQRLGPEFPLGPSGSQQIRGVIAEYRDVYGGGIWVYNDRGELLESAFDAAPLEGVLESARLGALGQRGSYALSDLRPSGWIVAGKPLVGRDGANHGAVVTASSADQPAAILKSVRDRLWTTFWTSLIIAGLIGFAFSEIIARRIRAMSDAAASIDAGNFEQRLSTSLVPDEIQGLAESYNSMAERLGKAFSAIQENERQIAAVVDSMAEGVLAIDAEEKVRVANPEALRLLGLEGRDLVGERLTSLTDSEDVLDIVRGALASRNASSRAQLGRFMVMLHCTPLFDERDGVEGAVLLISDVTERHRLEDAQRRFVADASHEMRTPIAALKGMLELLDDGAKENPEVRDDFIQTMQGEVDRLGRLVADLLTLARLEAGSLRLKQNPEYVLEMLEDVTGVMQTLAEQSGVTLSVEVLDPETQAIADHDRIVQVLLSFTDNALKHSSAGTTIHLRAARRGASVRFEVADEGEGIGAEELSRVFERFYRADDARASGSGTGLGLAIAKEIIEAHGAEITVESMPGVGTTFAFELPYVAAVDALTQP
ncbi:MAG: ATP-binding protein [Coriobacteriia bacterium]|nr:ATP-binding protein [Coriobacteriia bacterium]